MRLERRPAVLRRVLTSSGGWCVGRCVLDGLRDAFPVGVVLGHGAAVGCFFHSDLVTEAEADWREEAMRLRAALDAAVVTLAARTDTQRS